MERFCRKSSNVMCTSEVSSSKLQTLEARCAKRAGVFWIPQSLARVSPAVTVILPALTAILLSASLANAGTVLWAPTDQPQDPTEARAWPVSRFGYPPAQPAFQHEADDSFTSSQAGAQPDTVSRSPAGMMAPLSEKSHAEPVPSSWSEAAAIRKSGVQEVSLIAGDLGFFPKTVFVTRDIPVRMYVTGASKDTLCIMMDSFQVRKQVSAKKIEEISFTPSQPGTYRFYCPINGMEGSLVVKELVSKLTE